MNDIPKAGEALKMEDVTMIAEAVKARQMNFPDEPIELTVLLVLVNIGDRYSPVTCTSGEWEGIKTDVPKGNDPNDLPVCPNGHALYQGAGLKLGWLSAE